MLIIILEQENNIFHLNYLPACLSERLGKISLMANFHTSNPRPKTPARLPHKPGFDA